MNASRDCKKVIEKIGEILYRLYSVGKEQEKVMEDLKKQLKNRVDGALEELKKYLSSEEVKARFTSWTLDEVPNVESSWYITENEIENFSSATMLLKKSCGIFKALPLMTSTLKKRIHRPRLPLKKLSLASLVQSGFNLA